jgi:hypothetical protein
MLQVAGLWEHSWDLTAVGLRMSSLVILSHWLVDFATTCKEPTQELRIPWKNT